tara:strand:+ start:6478 stop:6663 length:186 start_codon:yes stop_codon:yes gene_type:complete
MPNPLYGQNKADDAIDAVKEAVDAGAKAAGGAAATNGAAAKVLQIEIGGVTYYIPLHTANS